MSYLGDRFNLPQLLPCSSVQSCHSSHFWLTISYVLGTVLGLLHIFSHWSLKSIKKIFSWHWPGGWSWELPNITEGPTGKHWRVGIWPWFCLTLCTAERCIHSSLCLCRLWLSPFEPFSMCHTAMQFSVHCDALQHQALCLMRNQSSLNEWTACRTISRKSAQDCIPVKQIVAFKWKGNNS